MNQNKCLDLDIKKDGRIRTFDHVACLVFLFLFFPSKTLKVPLIHESKSRIWYICPETDTFSFNRSLSPNAYTHSIKNALKCHLWLTHINSDSPYARPSVEDMRSNHTSQLLDKHELIFCHYSLNSLRVKILIIVNSLK